MRIEQTLYEQPIQTALGGDVRVQVDDEVDVPEIFCSWHKLRTTTQNKRKQRVNGERMGSPDIGYECVTLRIWMFLQHDRHQINLDHPPNKRWEEVISDYTEHFQQIEKIINDLVSTELGKTGQFFKSLVSATMSTITKCGAVYYGEELKAIANQSGMPLGLLVVMQLIYEASAHCTSIVCNDEKGKPLRMHNCTLPLF